MFTHKKVTAAEVKEMLDKGKDFVLLDVRTKEEFADGHIKGAINIPLQVLENEVTTEIEDKEAMIVLYCRSGVRTLQADCILGELGYDNVYDMGGILSWPYEIHS